MPRVVSLALVFKSLRTRLLRGHERWEQELKYWVDWLVAQRHILAMWQGRLEALLARHWPEATRVLKLSRVTLLRVLERYGGAISALRLAA